ncbi:MAG: hypothetical protein HZB92_09475 [Euryarchaeota archaeon]|nr:hypothetical protein [Euryarchaeota archaeon]
MAAKVAMAILAAIAVATLGLGAVAMGAGRMAVGRQSMMGANGCPGSGMMKGSDCPMDGDAGGGRDCSMDPRDCPHHDGGATPNCPSHWP